MGLLDRPQQPQRFGLLSPETMSLIQNAQNMPVPAPRAPARQERGQPGFLTYLLGGSQGMAAERAARQAEIDRPQLEARRAQLRAMAEQMGPAALLAYDLNPEKFGENLAEQYAPQVIASGGIQSVIGNGQRVSAPRDIEFGDSLVRADPLRPQPETLMQRGPTFQEQTARLSATSPVNVAPGNVLIDPQTGEQRGSGRDRILSAAEGTDLVSESGAPIYQNAPPPRAAAARPAAAIELEGRIDSTAREVVPSLTRMREIIASGEAFTGWGAQARLEAARIAAAAGNRDAARRVAATEEIINLAGRLRVGMAKTLGANPSNADLLLLNQVSGGDIGQNPETLLRLVDQGLELSNRQVSDLQRQLQAFGSQDGGQPAPAPAAGRRLSPQEASALPPGTRFIGTDGVERVRQ